MQPGDRIETVAKTKIGYVRERMEDEGQQATPALVVDPRHVQALVDEWPATPKKVANQMIAQYGPPHEATPARLVWHRNGRWKRTLLLRDEIPHRFPTAHTDFLMQYIDYRVPTEKFNDLARFDGSVIVDRTAGEMAARCDAEEMNVLTINLAHEVVAGSKTVDEARKVYADNAAAWLMNRPAPYTEKFLFDVPQGGTADLDESVIAGSMLEQAGEKVTDMVTGRPSDDTP